MSVIALGLYSAFIKHSFRIKLLKLLNLSQLKKKHWLFGKVNTNALFLKNDLIFISTCTLDKRPCLSEEVHIEKKYNQSITICGELSFTPMLHVLLSTWVDMVVYMIVLNFFIINLLL